MANIVEADADAGTALIRFILDIDGGRQFIVPAGALAELLGMLDRRWQRQSGTETRLVVRSIREGSLIIELGIVEVTTLAGGALIMAAGHINSLFEFAKNIEETFGRLKTWRKGRPLEPEDHEIGRAIAALTSAGLTVTLSAAISGQKSVYARVSPQSVADLTASIDFLAGPPPVQLIAEAPIKKNVTLFVLQDGAGYRAFVPAIDPRPLPFSGAEITRSENAAFDLDGFDQTLVRLSGRLVGTTMMTPVPDEARNNDSSAETYFGQFGRPRADVLLRMPSALGKGYVVDLEVVPGSSGPEEYRVLRVLYEKDA